MTKRRGISGLNTRTNAKPPTHAGSNQTLVPIPEVFNRWGRFGKILHSYLTLLYSTMCGNYVVIITILVVLLLSFLLPDISQKAQATQELKNMRTVLDKISREVKKAEVACLTVADDICCLHNTMHADAKESTSEVQDLSFCANHHVRCTQSEPAKVEKKIGFFRRIIQSSKNTSNKEIAIMSYVYTDSFEAKKQMIDSPE